MADNLQLDLVASYIFSGNSILILGPNFSRSSVNIVGNHLPSFFEFPRLAAKHFGLNREDFDSDAAIIDYLTRNSESERRVRELLKQQFGVKAPHKNVAVIPRFVWRRIYSFDLSDALETAFRRDTVSKQRLIPVNYDAPIPRLHGAHKNLELVKLNGDGLSLNTHNSFTTPDFQKQLVASKRYRAFKLDLEIHPVIVLGTSDDEDFLFNELRSLRRSQALHPSVFVCPGLRQHQVEILSDQGAIYVDMDGVEFLATLSRAFPDGRSLDDIAQSTTGFVWGNPALQEAVTDSFTVLTAENFSKLQTAPAIEGGIYQFYRGGEVTWNDILKGIHGDLVPYQNW